MGKAYGSILGPFVDFKNTPNNACTDDTDLFCKASEVSSVQLSLQLEF